MGRQGEKLAILGLGLMGGSLGTALVRQGYNVAGCYIIPEVVKEALEIGAINVWTESMAAAVSGAGVVFVATPAFSIGKVIKEALAYATPGTIFSDLGSIKGQIIGEVEAFLPEDYYFVPGHPMTGSERNGIAAVDPFLFQNAAYILVDLPRNHGLQFERVKKLVQATGAHLIILTADEHDRITAIVSHLPHLLAAVLAKTAGTAEGLNPGTLALAAGGFRDTTRIAMGSPELWAGILSGNREKLLEALDLFENELVNFKELLSTGKVGALTTFLAEAKNTRVQIPAKSKGFLTSLHEMVVTIEDRPGTIEAVLRYLSQEQINIKDIEILRVREGDGGTLRLALEDQKSLEGALQVMAKYGFKDWARN